MNDLLENGRNLLSSLKIAAGSTSRAALVIPVGSPPTAFLRPIATCAARLRQEDVVDLTDWRNRFVTSFLTEFTATPDRTASWLVNVVGPNESKILFMVDLLDGTTVGHIGIDFIDWAKGYAEADAIVRGREAPRGLMRDALLTAIAWAKDQLGLTSIGVRVKSDNPALHFYSKMGFVEVKRIPLRRIAGPELTRLVEDTDAKGDICLVHMLMN
jgi:RimJ/RimL family protein N-acetyltransferase